MVDRPTDESGDGGGADEGKILTPQELDITESEYVEEIDEGRYVVSPETRGGQPQGGQSGRQPQGGQGGSRQSQGSQSGGRQPQGTGQAQGGGQRGGGQPNSGQQGGRQPARTTSQRGNRQPQQGGQSPQLTEQEVREWLKRKYQQSDATYAFDVTAQFEGTVSQRRMASNDLIPVFESLMLWYAQQVDSSMPVEEVLGILLNESNVPVRYPTESVRNLVKSTDLGPDDTIADLLEAVQERDGVQL